MKHHQPVCGFIFYPLSTTLILQQSNCVLRLAHFLCLCWFSLMTVMHRWGEWKQLGAFTSQPITFWWWLKVGGEWHTKGSHPQSEPALDPLQTSFPFACQPETLVCLGPFLFSWLPTTLSEDIVYLGTPLIPQAPIHLHFPWGLQEVFGSSAQKWHLFIGHFP